MQDLTVVGVEDGALVVASEHGDRYRIAIDETLQSRLRQSISQQNPGKKVSPREIQNHIRSGLSAEEVASLTGASVEYVERFEGPILAERSYVVNSALKVAVRPNEHADPLGEDATSTFGDAIAERLESLGSSNERWASWKDEEGWVVKLAFEASDVEHDARWQYDPKRHSLTPLNKEAATLSQHGELTEGLIPRLRAVSISPAEPSVETPVVPEPTAPTLAPVANGANRGTFVADAVASHLKRNNEAPDDSSNQTADLLEALRRRRGEREAAITPAAENAADDLETIAPVVAQSKAAAAKSLWAAAARENATPADIALDGLDDTNDSGPVPSSSSKAKRSRASMPSWDEIVFGARSDDDLG